jgi:hypothetical protein
VTMTIPAPARFAARLSATACGAAGSGAADERNLSGDGIGRGDKEVTPLRFAEAQALGTCRRRLSHARRRQ